MRKIITMFNGSRIITYTDETKIMRSITRGTHCVCNKNGLMGEYFKNLSIEKNLQRLAELKEKRAN